MFLFKKHHSLINLYTVGVKDIRIAVNFNKNLIELKFCLLQKKCQQKKCIHILRNVKNKCH